MFDRGQWRDYSDLDVFQMIGRAGRPQFDTEGVCVIMTDQDHQAKWADLLKGETTVESTLHHTLIEHANAEIVFRGSCSVRGLQAWLRQTFFYVRLSKKPEYYKLPGCEDVEDADEALYVTSHRIMNELSEHNLVEDYNKDDDERLVYSSKFGVIMSDFSLRFETMQVLLKVERNSSKEKLIELLSSAKEYEGILLRSGEKGLYEQVRQYPGIPFPPAAIEKVSDKIAVIFQARLAGIDLDVILRNEARELSVNPKLDINTVMEHASGIVRAILNIAVHTGDGGTARNAFELARCTTACAWEGTQAELRQINGIGAVFMQTLGEAGIETIDDLARSKAERLQLLLDKSVTQARKIIKEARTHPRFLLSVKESMGKVVEGKGVESQLDVSLALDYKRVNRQNLPLRRSNGRKHGVGILITTTDPRSRTCLWNRAPLEELLDGTVVPTQKLLLQSADEEIIVTVACDTLSGTVIESRVRPSCPDHLFAGLAVQDESEVRGTSQVKIQYTDNVCLAARPRAWRAA